MSSFERDKEVKSLIKVSYRMAYRADLWALFVNICLLLYTLEEKENIETSQKKEINFH
jgi:hypothetical protein